MGLATLQKLYSLGHDIVIASRSQDKLEPVLVPSPQTPHLMSSRIQ